MEKTIEELYSELQELKHEAEARIAEKKHEIRIHLLSN